MNSPESILVQPNGVAIPGDEFLDGQSFNQPRSQNSLLLSIDEDLHVLPLSLATCLLFGGGSFAFWFGHFAYLRTFPNATSIPHVAATIRRNIAAGICPRAS
jgi:hypothetical protein